MEAKNISKEFAVDKRKGMELAKPWVFITEKKSMSKYERHWRENYSEKKTHKRTKI